MAYHTGGLGLSTGTGRMAVRHYHFWVGKARTKGDTSPNAETSACSGRGTFTTKITTEAAAELLGRDVADRTPATCRTEYAAAWHATHVPDPIETSVTKLEDSVAQLHADNTKFRSRLVALEGSLSAIRVAVVILVVMTEKHRPQHPQRHPSGQHWNRLLWIL